MDVTKDMSLRTEMEDNNVIKYLLNVDKISIKKVNNA